MKNIFTIDFESIGFANLIENPELGFAEDNLVIPLNKILNLLKVNNHTATFFFVGMLAEKFPWLVREVVYQGHRIGSHSYSHKLVYNQTPEVFESDLKKSLDILSKISGQIITSYRAPSWSYKNKISKWYWNILKNNGIKYDSSVFPVKNYLYGEPDAPRFIHKTKNGLVEVPPSTIKILNTNYPFSGGFYFRFLPLNIVKAGIRYLNYNKVPSVFYIHPWEIDQNVPRVKSIKIHEKFITYYNIKNTYNKLEVLCNEFEFSSIEEYLENYES